MKLDLIALISNLDFPAIDAMYLLIKIGGKLENLSSNIYELNDKK
ncbi:MAG: YvrJ family protein [Paraclostridium sp.]